MDNIILQQIKDYCNTNRDIEMCGAVVHENNTVKMYGIKNTHPKPNNNFRLDPYEYAMIEDSCDDVLFIFHSHINGKGPSFFDKMNCNSNRVNYLIYDVVNDKFINIEPKEVEYLHRKFEIGVYDCYSLVRDYYKEELGIKLCNYYRDKSWFSSDKKLFDLLFEQCGFYKVDDLQPNDCILFKIKHDVHSDHVGIYIDNNKFLHHPIKGSSEIIDLSGIYKESINYFVRHASLK